jgi:hypothetical protein
MYAHRGSQCVTDRKAPGDSEGEVINSPADAVLIRFKGPAKCERYPLS